MDPVEVDRVWVAAAVEELDANAIALDAAQRRTGHTAVVDPAREDHAGRDLELLVDGHDAVLAQRLAAGQRADLTEVPILQDDMRVEAVDGRVDLADRAETAVILTGGVMACAAGGVGRRRRLGADGQSMMAGCPGRGLRPRGGHRRRPHPPPNN